MGHGAWSYQLEAEPTRAYPIPVWYRVRFDVDDVPSRLELVIDGFDGADHRLYLNGAEVTRDAWSEPASTPRCGASTSRRSSMMALTSWRSGSSSRGRPADRGPGEADGNVSLAGSAADGWRIAAPVNELPAAPWTEHGHPFLSGTGTYRRSSTSPPGSRGTARSSTFRPATT